MQVQRKNVKVLEMEEGKKDTWQILQGIIGHVRDFGHCSQDKRNRLAFNSTRKLIVLPGDNPLVFKSDPNDQLFYL